MRIALCLSGIPRCYNYQPQSLINLFAPHKVDIFMHLWDDYITQKQKEEIIAIWNPEAVIFESAPTLLFNRWCNATENLRSPGRFHYNTFPMWYSVNRCNALKKQWEIVNGYTYDAVCKARTDIWAKDCWTEALELIKPNHVITLNTNQCDGYNDTMALGDSFSVDAYSAVWDWFPTALKNSCTFGYETMLKEYLDKWTNIKVITTFLDNRIIKPYQRNWEYDQLFNRPEEPPAINDIVRDSHERIIPPVPPIQRDIRARVS